MRSGIAAAEISLWRSIELLEGVLARAQRDHIAGARLSQRVASLIDIAQLVEQRCAHPLYRLRQCVGQIDGVIEGVHVAIEREQLLENACQTAGRGRGRRGGCGGGFGIALGLGNRFFKFLNLTRQPGSGQPGFLMEVAAFELQDGVHRFAARLGQVKLALRSGDLRCQVVAFARPRICQLILQGLQPILRRLDVGIRLRDAGGKGLSTRHDPVFAVVRRRLTFRRRQERRLGFGEFEREVQHLISHLPILGDEEHLGRIADEAFLHREVPIPSDHLAEKRDDGGAIGKFRS